MAKSKRGPFRRSALVNVGINTVLAKVSAPSVRQHIYFICGTLKKNYNTWFSVKGYQLVVNKFIALKQENNI